MRSRLAAVLASSLLALPLASPPAHSAEGELGFAVTPSRLDLQVEPGQRTSSSIRVYNRGGQTLHLRADVGNADIPKSDLVGDDELAFTAKRWVRWEREFVDLQAGDFIDLVLRVEVPPDGAFGGYHALAYLQTISAPSKKTGVVGAARIGVSVLVNVAVAGARIERSTRVAGMDLRVRQKGLFGSSVETSTTVENTGETHAFVGGVHTYRVWPGSGNATKKVGPHTLLRGTRHTFVSSWGTPLFGKVTVTSEIAYQRGPGDVPAIVMQKTVWIIPWRLIGLVLALGVGGLYRRRRRRRRRRGSAAAKPPLSPLPTSPPPTWHPLVGTGARKEL